MSEKLETNRFTKDLEGVARVRSQVVGCLNKMVHQLKEGELEGASTSGELDLSRDIEDLTITSTNLKQGVFRLLVLGDMKRGKSTFINALIGENILPCDVNPCTAILTVLRYGIEKKVTVYFRDDRPQEYIDIGSFKQKYTIDLTDVKQPGKSSKYDDIEYAVIEYPLPLLEKGIEIVDSPGLNDTESRNKLALDYIKKCQSILFVFRAVQPYTLEERRYLENYVKGRGLPVLFLINGWDEVGNELIDSDVEEEVSQAKDRLRKLFRTNLADYCQVDGEDRYRDRVFEISALNAIRRRLKNPEDNLEGTGFPEFIARLNRLLTKEKAVSQIGQARTIAYQVYHRIHSAIQRRLALLNENLEELRSRIDAIAPELGQLQEICDRFQDEIRWMRDRKARELGDSFRTYLLSLENTFESDFLGYQPEIGFWDFLQKGKGEEFNAAFKQAFEKYLNDKMATWEATAEMEIQDAFSQLANSAAIYGTSYNLVVDEINQKLIGKKLYPSSKMNTKNNSPSWTSWAIEFISLSSFLSLFSVNLILGPVGIMLLALGIGIMQTEKSRKEIIKATKQEFMKHLPDIAQAQCNSIDRIVKDCFDNYEREVIKRINDDIKSIQGELENLSAQKQISTINRESELKRLKELSTEILSECQTIESGHDYLLALVNVV